MLRTKRLKQNRLKNARQSVILTLNVKIGHSTGVKAHVKGNIFLVSREKSNQTKALVDTSTLAIRIVAVAQ